MLPDTELMHAEHHYNIYGHASQCGPDPLVFSV